LVLGIALAASPLAAALAIRPGALADAPALWWLAGMVTLWVAGFDVVYAMQDIDFDRGRGLRSIPARLGVRGAAWASRALHLGAVGCLLLAGRAEPRLGALYWVGVGGVVALLLAEHAIVALRRRPGLEAVYFTLNGVVSCVLGTAGVLDVVLAG
ncbi:MAG TPA: UbiA family prenyltransferase, partial [Phycisphaerales bacterium]|nr:UbiA family prenyltransferase [Phycisphaerales bacterium]